MLLWDNINNFVSLLWDVYLMHTVSLGITLFSRLIIYQSLILISGSVFRMSLDFKLQHEPMCIFTNSALEERWRSAVQDVMLWWGLSWNDSSRGLPPCYKTESSGPSCRWSISVIYLRYLCSLHWATIDNIISQHPQLIFLFIRGLFSRIKNGHLIEGIVLRNTKTWFSSFLIQIWVIRCSSESMSLLTFY